MLHQPEPVEVIGDVRRLVEVHVRFPLEDPDDAALLLRPSVARHVEVLEVSRQRTVERPPLVALAAKRPIRVWRPGDVLEERLPGLHPDDPVRTPFALAFCHPPIW